MDDKEQRFDLKTIINAAVLDGSGHRLGEIDELVFNADHDCIEYVHLLLDGESSSPLKVIVPWSQLSPAADRTHLTLDISPAILRAVARQA